MSIGAEDWRGREWEKWGREDPYFGVISDPRFLSDRMNDSDRGDFFRSGEQEMALTFATVERLLGRPLAPRNALDFGCGVGRLTMPLARRSVLVTGVDISPAMIEEARRNCARESITNVDFRTSLPGKPEGRFDFVHSFIVFQHIPPEIGYALFEGILDLLLPDAAGMVHVTYAREESMSRRFVRATRRSVPLAHRFLNVIQGRKWSAPLMAMFDYDLAAVLGLLESHGCECLLLRLTNHGGCRGAMIHFARGASG